MMEERRARGGEKNGIFESRGEKMTAFRAGERKMFDYHEKFSERKDTSSRLIPNGNGKKASGKNAVRSVMP